MAISLIPQQRPEQGMKTVTIEEILSLGRKFAINQPPLEHYFSPGRKEQFIKEYIHYLNSSLLEAKHGQMDLDLYLMFVISFQFIAPLLGISAEKELVLFYRILQDNYNVDEPDINLHFTINSVEEGMAGEDEALTSFRHELEHSYTGRRDVKESVQGRLKQDAIEAISKWQKEKDLPSLAEAFGRSVVIPSFFSFPDKRLLQFYQSTTSGISYEVAIPVCFGEETGE
jgi:hypothetical protein